MRSLQWRPLNLLKEQVGLTVDLAHIVQRVVDLQATNGLVMPLLLDENIHYRLSRFMYGRSYAGWDVRALLRQVPLLYGIWHPYKQTLWIVHRCFFPIIAQVESLGMEQQWWPIGGWRTWRGCSVGCWWRPSTNGHRTESGSFRLLSALKLR